MTRDTFYRYASSPVELLALALGEELDSLPLPTHGGVSAFLASEAALLEHISRHASVYRHALVSGSDGPVRDVLTRRIAEALDAYVQAHPHIRPPQLAQGDQRVANAMSVSYAAAGTVGAIEAWLRDGASVDIESAAGIIVAASPEWWVQPVVGDGA